MARRYARDNRGRFSSTGATARGGRLRTAAGNKRATVTASPGAADKASSAPKGTIGKTRKQRDVQALDRPQSQRGAFSQSYKAQRAAAQQRKATPAATVAAKATRVGGRLNPASKAERAATKKVEQAMSRERAARSTAMRTQGAFSSPARQKANQDLENASRETASAIQTRRNIRAQFPVQTKTPTVRGPRIASTVAKPASTTSQRQRAQSNLTKAEDKRTFTGQNRIKAKRTARKALEFYENPRKALKNRKPGLGFRMPRGFR